MGGFLNRGNWGVLFCGFLMLLCGVGFPGEVDLSEAVIVHPSNPRHIKAGDFLADEIKERMGVSIVASTSMPSSDKAAIVIGTLSAFPTSYSLPAGISVPTSKEGFALWINTTDRAATTVYIVGRDDRAVLFGVGMLLRKLNIEPGRITIDGDLHIATSPVYSIRGHKLLTKQGNPKDIINWTDSDQKIQMALELAMFGTNIVDIHKIDRQFDIEVSQKLAEYGLDCWMTFSGGKLQGINETNDIRERFGKLDSIDGLSIPGGDFSGTPEHGILIDKIKSFAPLFRQVYPETKFFFSLQCGKDHAQEQTDLILDYLQRNRPAWLTGISYGPWTKTPLDKMRQRLGTQYVIKHKPDICHNRGCQYMIPKWPRPMARTWGRNGISAMPRTQASIIRATQKYTDGFIAYNHTGTSNDINKFIWSALAWDPSADVNDILFDYGRVFFGYKVAKDVADGLLMLEDNWRLPAEQNDKAQKTLEHWLAIAKKVPGGFEKNWRLEIFTTRAYIDAQVVKKYNLENQLETKAYQELKKARQVGVAPAIANARKQLARIDTEFVSKEKMLEQMATLGLKRYADMDSTLDNLYHALNNRQWLEVEFEKILAMDDKDKQLSRIARIVNWEDPGPGGFYDNLGVVGKQPHLVRNKRWEDDPGFDYSPIEFNMHKPASTMRQSMLVSAFTRYNNPLIMRWTGLDKTAQYKMRVIYAGPYKAQMTCETDEGLIVHGPTGNAGPKELEYDIPTSATSDGTVELKWKITNIVRGPSVSEIWIIKK